MKKILMFFLLLFLASTNCSFGDITDIYKGTILEGKTLVDISRNYYEDAFLISYQISEQDINGENSFIAFMEIGGLYGENALDVKYRNNEIQATELKTLLGELIAATQNPQTAKDYFYKGLFSYPSYPSMEVSGMFYYFDYVINNFPDTIYAKYSYLMLAGNHSYAGKRYAEANNILNNFITKYGESDLLISNVYYQLAENYYNLYLDTPKTNVQEKQNYGKLMLTYSDKILNEFPGEKNMIAWVQFNLAHYYSLEGNSAESQNYYYKIYNEPTNSKGLLPSVLHLMVRKYKINKNYYEADKLLEDAKVRYFSNSKVRKIYKENKQNLDEIKYFGYDEYERSNASRQIYKQKKALIDAFRAQYEASWDADFNMIAPFANGKYFSH